MLLRALGRLGGEKWFCIAAGGRHESAAHAVARAGLADRVRVMASQDPRPLYGAADLVVQPTWRDPCSLATLEALACGVPVVTTTANGAAEVAASAQGPISVVSPGDAAGFATAVEARLTLMRSAPRTAATRAAARAAAPTVTAWRAEVLAALLRAATSAARR